MNTSTHDDIETAEPIAQRKVRPGTVLIDHYGMAALRLEFHL